MNKPKRSYPKPIGDVLGRCLGDVFARQGFASGELVRHWPEIVGDEIAELAEPLKLQWPRQGPEQADEDRGAARLLVRVDGPAAIEIQHLAPVIIERVNRYFGWRAVGRLGIRQAPHPRRTRPRRPAAPDPIVVEAERARLPPLQTEELRDALARLGAALRGA